jgi:Yip1 domain
MESVPPVPEPQAFESPAPAMSLAGRLMNIFAAPGDVFDEIKAAPPRAANWLVPVLLTIVVGVISCFVIFAQPGVRESIHEQQVKALDQRVKQGKMTQAQEDQALQMMDRFTGPTMLAVFGSFGVAVNSFIAIFWWALLLWLFGRWFLKTQFPYMKAVEVVGLASMIILLGLVLTTLLSACLGRLYATPSLGLLVSNFDPTRRGHLLLGAVNPIYFWHTGLLALGLAKLSAVPAAKAAAIVFGYWILAELLLIAVGLGQWAL